MFPRASITKISPLIAAAAFVSLPAFADDAAPSPDKSQYTLFNPVPDDLIRSFSTDRPTKSDSTNTVDAGHFQYESDIVSWIYDRYNTTRTTTSNFVVADPVLKIGLTQNTDFELALSPFNFNQSQNHASGTNNTAAGFGDVYARVKYNFFGNEGGDYALAIVPYVKAPTAAHNLGNANWEGGTYLPFQAALPFNWTLNVTPELDILENAALNGDHANFQNAFTFGHRLFTDSLTGYAEFWSDFSGDTGAGPQYTADFALAWMVGANMQLDCGVNLGLNKAASDVQPYLGLSQRF